ncbi:hypothetical protein AB0E00_34555 [Streptomyces sp. NPDC048110]|uniref:hypothetical protein n=1 Tax=Streptomyces sp. NPDC048110 TaxID=3155483 RepID=UPI0033E8A348
MRKNSRYGLKLAQLRDPFRLPGLRVEMINRTEAYPFVGREVSGSPVISRTIFSDRSKWLKCRFPGNLDGRFYWGCKDA